MASSVPPHSDASPLPSSGSSSNSQDGSGDFAFGAPAILSGEWVGDRYRILRVLGQGGFGRTYLAKDTQRFDETCVLKEFAPQIRQMKGFDLSKAQQLFEREAGVLYRLDHPQIPKFRELHQQEINGWNYLFLVQDYIEGHTFLERLVDCQGRGLTLQEGEVVQLLRQILPVLDYLHRQGVIHRDISPDNLIQRQGDSLPVLIDFGAVKQAAATVLSEFSDVNTSRTETANATTGPKPSEPHPLFQGTRLGKLGYSPPEQMQYGTAFPHSDLYALGATALTLLSGLEPQMLMDPHTLEWTWKESLSLQSAFVQFLSQMVALRPADRYPSAAIALKALDRLVPPPSPDTDLQFSGLFANSGPLPLGSGVSQVSSASPAGPADASWAQTIPHETQASHSPPTRPTTRPAPSNSSKTSSPPATSQAPGSGSAPSSRSAPSSNTNAATIAIGQPGRSGSAAFQTAQATPFIWNPLSQGFWTQDFSKQGVSRSLLWPASFPDKGSLTLLGLGLLGLLGGLGLGLNGLSFNRTVSQQAETEVQAEQALPKPEPPSPTEQARMKKIERDRAALGIPQDFFSQLIAEEFAQRYPASVTKPTASLQQDPPIADETVRRAEQQGIAQVWLERLEPLSAMGRSRLGDYGADDWQTWLDQASQRNLNAEDFRQQINQEFSDRFVGVDLPAAVLQWDHDAATMPNPASALAQIWLAIAAEQAGAIAQQNTAQTSTPQASQAPDSAAQRSTIAIDAAGNGYHRATLPPAQRGISRVSLRQGQRLRITLESNNLSGLTLAIYPPGQTTSAGGNALLAPISQNYWEGILPQTGSYAVLVTSQSSESIDYTLNLIVEKN